MRIAIPAFILLVALAACHDKKTRLPFQIPTPVAQGCAGWQVGFVVGGVPYGTQGCSTGIVEVPECNNGAEPYSARPSIKAMTKPTGPLTPGSTVRVVIEVVGDANLIGTEEPQTLYPYASLYIQHAADDWSGTGAAADRRLYFPASPQFELRPGRHELSVTLTPDLWTGVIAMATPAGFADTLANARTIGVVFGTHGKAHGVCKTSGSATINILEFTP